MKVAVYSGSFNPLHKGHLAILNALCAEFDKVLLVVSPRNPLKDIDPESALARLEAAREAVGRHPELDGKVEVSDIEFSLPCPNYTYVTLDTLAEAEPGTEFTLTVGSDQLNDIRRWREYRHILKDYGLVVYPREGFDTEADMESLLKEDNNYRIRIVDAPTVNISSTAIRENSAAGINMDEWLM